MKTLIIGFVATIIIFGGIIMLPEQLINKVPSQLIPIIYCGISSAVVKWTQGDALKAHKENISGWKALRVAVISLAISGLLLYGSVLYKTKPIYETYNTQISEFNKNERESLTFYDNIGSKSDSVLLDELDNNVIPKWESNIKLLNELGSQDNLPSDLRIHNKALLKYSRLRLKTFLLIKKAYSENTDKYDNQLNSLHQEIATEMKNFNSQYND